MENEVRLPIVTTHDGEKTTKVCVEDVYKMVNRIYQAMDKAYNNSVDILESIPNYEDDPDTCVITGTGVSQPCHGDKYDEKTGENIAFMKAKLNANNKKYNFVRRVYNEYVDLITKLGDEMERILEYIDLDLDGIREHNPDYWKGRFEIND